MGTQSDDPAQDKAPETAEVRQIDALNRLAPEPQAPAAAAPARRRDAQLLETGAALAGSDALSETLRTVTRGLYAPDFPLDGLVVFGCTRKFLSVLGQTGFRRGGHDDVFRMPVTARFPAAEVVRTGRPAYLHTPEEFHARYPTTWPVAERHGRSAWAFLPLVVAGRITGVCLFAFASPVAFGADERALLHLAARLVAQALERSRVSTAEVALARVLRRSMGKEVPARPGITVAARYVPTGGGLVVGGDWYDVINLSGGRIALVIGDVQGHDTHAAGLMARLRTAVHAYAAEGHGPDAVLARASRYLSALDEDRFATCLYVEAEPRTGLLHMARAGHPHPVVRLPDGTCLIKHVPGGLPLGLMPEEHDYPVSRRRLLPGEIMLLCTDGLIETGGYDMFSGWVRVRDALVPGPADDLEDVADNLIRAVQAPTADARGDATGFAAEEGEEGPEAPVGAAGGPGEQEARERMPEDSGAALAGRPYTAPRNEDDIALLLLRRDEIAGRREPAVRRLMLTIGQDQAEGLSEARAELQALLHDWKQPEQVDTAVLLASELLGNVLVHTDQTAALSAAVSGDMGHRVLRVEVTDRGDELPHQRAPGELASSGSGLMMLDILAHEWSVRPETEGKTVWFCLAEDQEPPEGLAA